MLPEAVVLWIRKRKGRSEIRASPYDATTHLINTAAQRLLQMAPHLVFTLCCNPFHIDNEAYEAHPWTSRLGTLTRADSPLSFSFFKMVF
jgi:hypothetical protein